MSLQQSSRWLQASNMLACWSAKILFQSVQFQHAWITCECEFKSSSSVNYAKRPVMEKVGLWSWISNCWVKRRLSLASLKTFHHKLSVNVSSFACRWRISVVVSLLPHVNRSFSHSVLVTSMKVAWIWKGRSAIQYMFRPPLFLTSLKVSRISASRIPHSPRPVCLSRCFILASLPRQLILPASFDRNII